VTQIDFDWSCTSLDLEFGVWGLVFSLFFLRFHQKVDFKIVKDRELLKCLRHLWPIKLSLLPFGEVVDLWGHLGHCHPIYSYRPIYCVRLLFLKYPV
jgi:hypothetical protein